MIFKVVYSCFVKMILVICLVEGCNWGGIMWWELYFYWGRGYFIENKKVLE